MIKAYAVFAARGQTALWRYAASLPLAVGIAILLGIATVLCLRPLGVIPEDFVLELQHPSRPTTFFLGIPIIFGPLLLGTILAVRYLQNKRFADVIGDWSWSMYWGGAGTWFVAQLLMTSVDFVIAPGHFTVTASSETPRLIVSAILALILQTFTEEFIFRGHLTQGLFLATRQPPVAAALSGLLFGGLHIANGFPQAMGACAFGIVTSLIAIRTNGIAFSSGLHFANNLFAATIVVSTVDVFKDSPGLISQDTPQLAWWDVAITTLALFGALYLLTRRYYPDRNS